MLFGKTLLLAVVLFFVLPCTFAQVSLPGTYDVYSQSSDGETTTGTMQFTQSGEILRIFFTPPNSGTLELAGLNLGSYLFLAFEQGKYGLVVYQINRGKLSGKWFDPNLSSQPGKEELQGPDTLNGTYKITYGYSPTGATYSGSLSISPNGNLYQLFWNVGGNTYQGKGISFQNGTDRFLVASWGESLESGILGAYQISQPSPPQIQLSGKWTHFSTSEVGTEVMTLTPQQNSSVETHVVTPEVPPTNIQTPSEDTGAEFYVATQMKSRLNFNNQLTTRLYTYYLLLYPDGRFYEGLPKGGFNSFNFEQAQQNKPNSCGQYQIFGNQMQFQYPNRSEDYSFERTEYKLFIGKFRYEKVNLSPSGLLLEGLYINSNFTNTTVEALDSYGGVVSEQKIQFSNDGTFYQENFIGYSSDTSTDGSFRTLSSGSRSRSGSGSYQIQNGTIVLRYSDGYPQSATFYYFPADYNGGQIKMVVIDGISFLRSK